jgi:hypothetical protein
MKKLIETFEKYIGIPMPEIMLAQKDLVQIDGEKALLYASLIAKEQPALVQGAIREFIESAPEGYFLIGFWGHGVNSYAFYYSRVDEWSKIFFRLPYGGVYMDNDEMSRLVREFLTNYFSFEQEFKSRIKHLLAIESMDKGYYKLAMKSGQIAEVRESLFYKPNFKDRFAHPF